MAVYVGHERAKVKDYVLNHMVADNLIELHDMADKLGLRDSWFRMAPLGIAHYDITETIRKDAIALGAKPLTEAEMHDFIERFKRENHI